MTRLGIVRSLAIALTGAVFATAPVFAQTKPAAPSVPDAASAPEQSSLKVGALQIASATNLEVSGIDVNLTGDSVVYSYFFKNTGKAELNLMAVVSLPELQASADRSEFWVLASKNPENPVGLTITAAGTPVTTKADIHAYALGIDRLADIKAEHLPLIPFGPEVDKALAALAPEAADRLAALGIVSPHDAAQPKTPVTADWTLDVAHSWRQTLPPGKTTPVMVKFVPIKGQYRIGKGDQQDLADMKDDVCLTPQAMRALQAPLKSGGAWKVTDMTLAVNAPAHWIDGPQPSLAVQKPRPDAIVSFCGMDEKAATKPTVLGTAPDESEEVRIVIFEPAPK